MLGRTLEQICCLCNAKFFFEKRYQMSEQTAQEGILRAEEQGIVQIKQDRSNHRQGFPALRQREKVPDVLHCILGSRYKDWEHQPGAYHNRPAPSVYAQTPEKTT